jgi:hypothetical protein
MISSLAEMAEETDISLGAFKQQKLDFVEFANS